MPATGSGGRTMQDDITWGVKYLAERGISDPKRVGIFGGSYGGYATLAGVAFNARLVRSRGRSLWPLQPHHAA